MSKKMWEDEINRIIKGMEKAAPKSYSSFGSLSNRTTQAYVYKGKKNKTEFPEFIKLCKMTQEELFQILPLRLMNAGYEDVYIGDRFIYARGDLPYLLTAHMDTVHRETVKDFYEDIDNNGNHIISSPQGIGGDDRCGIYMILEIIKECKPYVLFCKDEEVGGVGSKAFCNTAFINELSDMKYLVELDRMNGTDAVFYRCDNKEFTKFIVDNTGYKKAYGSFSDISTLAPACGVAAVNLSCGYYHAHQLAEEVNVEEMLHTIEVVKKLFEVECEQFEYVAEVNRYSSYRGYYGVGNYYKSYNSRYYDDDYEDEDDFMYIAYVTYNDREHNATGYGYASGKTKEEAKLNFFINYPKVCYEDVITMEIDYT